MGWLLPHDYVGTGIGGTHDGPNNASTLTDSTASFIQSLVGLAIDNATDGSSGTISAVNSATNLSVTLSGGVGNDWDTGDIYIIGGGGWYNPQYAYDENVLTGAVSDRVYYNRPPQLPNYTEYIYLNTATPILSSQIYAYTWGETSAGFPPILQVEIQEEDGTWTQLYSGLSNVAPTVYGFDDRVMRAARARLRANSWAAPHYWFRLWIFEVRFWEIVVEETGTIIKHCIDENANPVVGAEIDLLDGDLVVIDTQVSGGDGIAIFVDVPVGTYSCDVVVIPDGYELESEADDIVVVAGEVVNAYNYFILIPPQVPRTYFILA